MLVVSLVLASMLVVRAMGERKMAARYGMMERAAGHLNAAAGWQAIERGVGATILGSAKPASELLGKYDELGKKGDAEAQQAASEIDRLIAVQKDADIEKKFGDWKTAWKAVQSARSSVKSAGMAVPDWVKAATKNIDSEFSLRNTVFSPHELSEQVLYYNSVVRANVATLCEYAGRERAALGSRLAAGEPISAAQMEALKAWRSIVDNSAGQVLALKSLSSTPPKLVAAIETFEKEFLGDYQQLRENVYAASAESKPYPVNGGEWITRATKAIDTGLAISNVIGGLAAEAADDISATARNAMMVNIGLSALSLAVFAFVLLFVRRKVIAPINSVIEGLVSGSEQIASASAEISSSSQALASGSTQQAAALEETSASLQNIAETSKSNGESASEADKAMTVSKTVVADGASAMRDMESAMASIKNSSGEISKIIKVIEEIAFQTNLLALNAAVEAARAGEHGKGFAVVAEEVRNLAQRSATASKDTASLIENAVKMADNGEKIVKHLASNFEKITDTTKKVGAVVSEIATASIEQASGVEQVNKAVSEMDRVTQQNAATAEESAAASEQLSAQAETLYDHVADLTRLVTGEEHSQERTADGSVAYITWKKEYELGVPDMDNQHKRLVQLINELYVAMKSGAGGSGAGKALKGVVDYTKQHFGNEERLQQQYGYPGLGAHKTLHKELLEQVLDFKQRYESREAGIESKLAKFLKDWLINHIMGQDQKYAAHILGR